MSTRLTNFGARYSSTVGGVPSLERAGLPLPMSAEDWREGVPVGWNHGVSAEGWNLNGTPARVCRPAY